MDEGFDFVYEDLDYSHTLYQAGYPIIVLRDLKIYHMEKDKTKLDHAWIGNIYQAHRKAKHRILFVKKHAKRRQKLQFYSVGFLGQPLWLIAKVFLLAPRKDILPLLKAIRRGTCDGIKK
ncbi:TPA: hypothetical protein DEP21_03630 [Patescibacteria group bacterium]|nr:hypothetical protein [Candidatus Gracilibacteria bacterium]